jgi:hypothetical protein
MENPQRLALLHQYEPSKKDFLSIVTGMLLGDGSIVKKYPKTLVLCHSEPQKEYLLYKMNLLNKLGYSNGKIRTMSPKLGNTAYIVDFTDSRFEWFYKKIYKHGKKKITWQMLRHLTPIGLAIWYMDDGNLSQKRSYKQHKYCTGLCLNTQCFSLVEQKIIQKWFRKKHGFNLRFHKDKQYIKIYFPAKDGKKFIDVIRPYIPQSMEYKVC